MTLKWCSQSAGWPTDPAYSRNPKPPALAGGCSPGGCSRKWHVNVKLTVCIQRLWRCVEAPAARLTGAEKRTGYESLMRREDTQLTKKLSLAIYLPAPEPALAPRREFHWLKGITMKKISLLITSLIMMSSTVAYAVGDPKAGEAKAELCFDCHGVGGNSEDSTFPKLAGQFDYYIIKQIKDFKSGARKDDTMTDMAMIIESDQDLEDIAAYFSAQPDMAGEPTDSPRMVERIVGKRGEEEKVIKVSVLKLGKDIYMDGGHTKCFECHGADARGGGGMMKGAPKLAGQHKEYMLKAMDDIHTKKRRADMFNLMWRGLNVMSEEEREFVAEYLSSIPAAE